MSQRNSGYNRVKGDAYYTPFWVTRLLFEQETFGKVFDPACGDNHILAVALNFGLETRGTDITGGSDFLLLTEVEADEDIVSNPPFSCAEEFIAHALELTRKTGRKVAMLLRVDFDSAKTRRYLFEGHPAFARKYVLTSRIRWANLEQKKAGPSQNHAWFVWDWRKPKNQSPDLRYLFKEAEAA